MTKGQVVAGGSARRIKNLNIKIKKIKEIDHEYFKK